MQMTGGQALAQSLKIEGIETLFALPGIQLDYLFDGIWEERDHFKVLHTRHEQATAYMADGFAHTTGRIGTSIVVPGPGLLNAAAGLSTAYACSSPVLMVTGQVNADQIGKGAGALHEINNQLETISSVVKQAERALTPEEIPGMVRRAAKALQTGRPRPVEIEVPPDVLGTIGDVTLLEPESWDRSIEHPADADRIEQAARLLGAAERPVICAGGGVLSSEAWTEIRELAAMLEAPVLMSSNGRGVVSDREYLGQTGRLAQMELVPNADAILVVGSRFLMAGNTGFGGPTPIDGQVVQIEIDGEELGRNYPPDVGILADAKQAVGALLEAVPAHNRSRESREAELTALKERSRELWNGAPVQSGRHRDPRGAARRWHPRQREHAGRLLDAGRRLRGLRTSDAGHLGLPGHARLRLRDGAGRAGRQPRTEGRLDQRRRRLHVQRSGAGHTGTAAHHTRHHRLQRQRLRERPRIQSMRYNGHVMATDLHTPDMVKMAEAFGMAAWRAEGPDELRGALREALASNAPALIEVPMPPTRDLAGGFMMEPLPPRPVLDL